MNLVGAKKFPDMILLQEEEKKIYQQMFFQRGICFSFLHA